MIYKNYSITNFDKWGNFQAFKLTDLDEPMIAHRLEREVKKEIDKRIKETNKL